MCLKIVQDIDTRIRKQLKSQNTLVAYKVVIFDNLNKKYISPIVGMKWQTGWNKSKLVFGQSGNSGSGYVTYGIHVFLSFSDAELMTNTITQNGHQAHVVEVTCHEKDFIGAGIHEIEYWCLYGSIREIRVDCYAESAVFNQVWVENLEELSCAST